MSDQEPADAFDDDLTVSRPMLRDVVFAGRRGRGNGINRHCEQRNIRRHYPLASSPIAFRVGSDRMCP